jgi:hypothetical protein
MRFKIIEQPDQYQLIPGTSIEPQLDGLAVQTEIPEAQVAVASVFAHFPTAAPVRPVFGADAVMAESSGAKMMGEFILRWLRSPDKRKNTIASARSAKPPCLKSDGGELAKTKGFIVHPIHKQKNGRQRRRQLNVLSARSFENRFS